jgi:hypothetical protein
MRANVQNCGSNFAQDTEKSLSATSKQVSIFQVTRQAVKTSVILSADPVPWLMSFIHNLDEDTIDQQQLENRDFGVSINV